MPVKINGSTSGSVTLAAPATGSDVTLTLPTGVVSTAGGSTITASSAGTVPLTVKGATSQSAYLLLAEDSSGTDLFYVSGSGFVHSSDGTSVVRIANSGGVGLFGTTSNHSLAFQTNDTERMRIDSSGNVGVGQIDANVRFTVQASANERVSYVYANNASYTSAENIFYVSRASTSAYAFLNCVSNAAGTGDVEFNLRGDGNGYADGTWTGGGADYAEYFEWADGNPNGEDRRGISVTLDGNKIKPAGPTDTIIGVISGNPSVVGDAAWNKWSEKYLRDDFGTYVMEDYEVLQWTDEDGNERAVDADGPDAGDAPANATVVVQQRRKLNPAYDPEQEYVSREQRPEWDCVGLMGKLRVRVGQPTDPRWIKMRDVSETVEEWLVR